MVRKLIAKWQRFEYLLKKVAGSFSNQVVIYTKKHPIYTSVFEEEGINKFTFVYIKLKGTKFSPLEKMLIAKAVVIHADAPEFPNQFTDKKQIVECEGKPEALFFTNKTVKKVLIESKSCLVGTTGLEDKVTLCYPSIKVNPLAEKTKSDDYITILCAGHGGFLKGYDVVFRLYKTLSAKHKIKLIIAGSFGHNFEYYPEVTREAYEQADFGKIAKELAADPNVTVRPIKREELLSQVYKSADIFLQLSRMETFGYSVVEAMSFGLPVVTCNFRALKEMIVHNDNGFLAATNKEKAGVNDYEIDLNSKEWADNCYNDTLPYLEKLITDSNLRKNMGKRSWEIANEKFNVTKKASQLEKLYQEVINNA